MENYFVSEKDDAFDALLPQAYQEFSKIHWTPIAIIEVVLEWLDFHKPKRLLDIGSGVGKFCLLSAQHSDTEFTGVEKRLKLHEQAILLKDQFSLKNVDFMHSDIVNIEFISFDAIYYYQPFCEQISEGDWIDKELDFSSEQFEAYEEYVTNQLKKSASGTLFISYNATKLELPSDYIIHDMKFDGMLQLWIKK